MHTGKDETIAKFLGHSDIEPLLWNLFWLLSYTDQYRISGNSAYIIGTLAESDDGIDRILSMLVDGMNPEKNHFLPYLVNMLRSNDIECLMNAAGTIGTIVST